MKNIVVLGDYLDYKLKEKDGTFYLSKMHYLDKNRFLLSRFKEFKVILDSESIDSYHILKREEETNISQMTSNAFIYSLAFGEKSMAVSSLDSEPIKIYQIALLFKDKNFCILKIEESLLLDLLKKLDSCKDKIDFKEIDFSRYKDD